MSDSSSDPADSQPLNIAADEQASSHSPPHIFNQDDNFVLNPQSIPSELSHMFRLLSGQLIDQQAIQSSELLNSISSRHKEAIYEQKARMDRILDEHSDTLQSVNEMEAQRRQTIAFHERLDDIVKTNFCTDSTSSNFFLETRHSSEKNRSARHGGVRAKSFGGETPTIDIHLIVAER